jgi:hypothetical protein
MPTGATCTSVQYNTGSKQCVLQEKNAYQTLTSDKAAAQFTNDTTSTSVYAEKVKRF